MAERIRVLRYFINVDMRMGEHNGLTKLLAEHKIVKNEMQFGEVVVCLNRRGNAVKVVTCEGILYQRLPEKETWKWKGRKNQLMALIGRAFGLQWSVSDQVFIKGRKEYERYAKI
jgi:hypothetical protein